MASRPARTTEHRPAADGLPELELVRSRRRRRTASARGEDGRVIVQLPADLPPDEEERLVHRLVRRVVDRWQTRTFGGDEALARRADELADRWLDGVRATSVRWSGRMERRWGSCTPAEGSIRVSQRIASYPRYVIDAILIHELAHLQAPGHGEDFRALTARYPKMERARGFLDGVEFAASRPSGPDGRPLAPDG